MDKFLQNFVDSIESIEMLVIRTMRHLLGHPKGTSEKFNTYVTDHSDHERSFAIDFSKLKNELKWVGYRQFVEDIGKTVSWYLDNQERMDNITSGEYEKYHTEMYEGALIPPPSSPCLLNQ